MYDTYGGKVEIHLRYQHRPPCTGFGLEMVMMMMISKDEEEEVERIIEDSSNMWP